MDGRKRIKVKAIVVKWAGAALVGKWSAILNPPSLAPSALKPIQTAQWTQDFSNETTPLLREIGMIDRRAISEDPAAKT
jgi:hypothetical protein